MSDDSVNNILENIRGVINGKEEKPADPNTPTPTTPTKQEDVLVLDTIAPPAGNKQDTPAPSKAPATTEAAKGTDVLNDIDKLLSNNSPAIPNPTETTPKPQEEIVAPQAITETPAVSTTAAPAANPLDQVINGSITNNTSNKEVTPAQLTTVKTEEVKAPIQEKPQSILSETVVNQSTEAIKTFMAKLPKTHPENISLTPGLTLEEIVKETIKPMLKEWIDQNLPDIIKKIVEKEIKKLMPNE